MSFSLGHPERNSSTLPLAHEDFSAAAFMSDLIHELSDQEKTAPVSSEEILTQSRVGNGFWIKSIA